MKEYEAVDYWAHVKVDFSSILGETIIDIDNKSNIIIFQTKNNTYILRHDQDCCENVYIEDICGELKDLCGTPLLLAEESSSSENPLKDSQECFTWTFYKLATINGSVTIRWYGSSNGYYSEKVSFYIYKNI